MRACESWVHQHDVPKIQLMVRRENADVIAFYAGIGSTDGEVVVLARWAELVERVGRSGQRWQRAAREGSRIMWVGLVQARPVGLAQPSCLIRWWRR